MRFRHDLKPSFTSSGLLQVRKNGGCSLPTWSCNPPKQKKHYVFEANAIETSDTVVLLSCSHFFSCCNQPICLPVALKHQSRKSPPRPPLEVPMFIPPEFPSKSHFCSLPRSHPNHLGAVKNGRL